MLSTVLTIFKSRDGGYFIIFLVCARGKSRVWWSWKSKTAVSHSIYNTQGIVDRVMNLSQNVFPIFSEYSTPHCILHRVVWVSLANSYSIFNWYSFWHVLYNTGKRKRSSCHLYYTHRAFNLYNLYFSKKFACCLVFSVRQFPKARYRQLDFSIRKKYPPHRERVP